MSESEKELEKILLTSFMNKAYKEYLSQQDNYYKKEMESINKDCSIDVKNLADFIGKNELFSNEKLFDSYLKQTVKIKQYVLDAINKDIKIKI